MTKSQSPPSTTDRLAEFGLGAARFLRQEKSSVTTAWGVDWSEELIARDLTQNFFDANRQALDKVAVTPNGTQVRIEAPATFDLHRLFYLGSEKGTEDVGQYGEGFKAATVCILRRTGTSVMAASGRSAVVIRLSEEPAQGTNLYPLLYDFYELEQSHPGSVLVVGGAWRKLCEEMKRGLCHFFHEKNGLIGRPIAQIGMDFLLFHSTTEQGHLFYRNLRRGDIPNLPVVLVLNKEYQEIERRVAKDRDRNAFGDVLLDVFYRVWAQRFFSKHPTAVEGVLNAAQPLWKRGNGHPLLAAIAGQMYYLHEFIQRQLSPLFADGYYAESRTRDTAESIRYAEFESTWRQSGRVKLPSYFASFGVISAEAEI